MRSEIGDFAFHPDVAVLAFHVGAHGGHQVAHNPNPALRRPEGETKLIGKGHSEEFTGEAIQQRTRCGCPVHALLGRRRHTAKGSRHLQDFTAGLQFLARS